MIVELILKDHYYKFGVKSETVIIIKDIETEKLYYGLITNADSNPDSETFNITARPGNFYEMIGSLEPFDLELKKTFKSYLVDEFDLEKLLFVFTWSKLDGIKETFLF